MNRYCLYKLLPLFLLCMAQLSYAQSEPDFAANRTNACTNDEFQFFISSTDTIKQWTWYFQGGNPDSSQVAAPRTIYPDTGRFDVTLEITTNVGSYVIEKEDYIYVDRFRARPRFRKEISGRTVTYFSEDQYGETLVWEFGDGTNSSETNPIHTFEEDGIYLTRLLSTNNCGTDAWADVVVIGDTPALVTTTANDPSTKYEGHFRPGSNLGFFPPWTDRELADIAAGNDDLDIPGVGCKAIRPQLSEDFLEFWGYDFRIPDYQHFTDLGLEDNTVIVGFPSDEHRDTTFYCPEYQSTLFANMYTPIWDNGENGTPVNDTNYLALYLYRLIHLYGDQITFYEVWNEPGFDFTFVTGFLEPGFDGNWWENDPEPCDYKLRAPIYHYVRTLRICYEVIKRFDPDAKVTLGSVGFGSFLDAILRNTDNPNGGAVTAEYPLGGGAYFDIVTLHSYPHFDGTLREYDNDIMGFVYDRHTDEAISGVPRVRDEFGQVLQQYGYDDTTYPAKQYTITECGVPRKEFGEFIGGEDVQINYIMKVYVESVIADMIQLHIYDLAESFGLNDAVSEFQVMGLYQRLFGIFPYNYTVNLQGIAYKTISDALYSDTYDPIQSAALNAPDSIRAEAFLDQQGHYTYAIWAKTSQDRSEAASATFSFPPGTVNGPLERIYWDYSQTTFKDTIDPTNIALDGRPILLRDLEQSVAVPPTVQFDQDILSGCASYQVQFTDQTLGNPTQWEWTFEGGIPASSTEQNPTVIYPQAGTFNVSLRVQNAQGQDSILVEDLVHVYDGLPTADFNPTVFDRIGTFENLSTNAETYSWSFGDFNVSDAFNPSNRYPVPGLYTVRLIASNPCGADTSIQQVIIGGDEFPPMPNFGADRVEGCAPFSIQFFNLSSANTDSVSWIFQGGDPAMSTEFNPTVTYSNPGSYFVQLTALNEAGSLSDFRANFITVTDGEYPVSNFAISNQAGGQLELVNQSTNATASQWFTGDGTTYNTTDFSHHYAQSGFYEVMLVSFNECGTDTLSQEIQILLASNAQFSVSDTEACVGETIQFTDQSIDVQSVSWIFEGGNPATSSAFDPVVTYGQSGFFDVQLIAQNATGSDTLLLDDYIQIKDLAVAAFSSMQNGNQTIFTNTSQFANSYNWNFGDGTISFEPNPIHEYPESGVYLAQLIAQNECGNDTLVISVDVLLLPEAQFELTPDEGCTPLEVAFEDFSIDADSVYWTFEGGTPPNSSAFFPTVQYNDPGLYWVELIAINATGSDTLRQLESIEVFPNPIAQFATNLNNGTVQLTNQSSDATTYLWDFGDNSTSMEVDPIYEYTSNGTYTIQLIATNGCGSDTTSQTIDVIITGVDDPLTESGFTLSPNPSTGVLYLSSNQSDAFIGSLELFDLSGKLIWEARNIDIASSTKIDLTHLPSAAYLLVCTNENGPIWQQQIILE